MRTTMKRQGGGTILGIIIGLVLGLGIAAAVAFMINKTPIPFLDRAARAAPAADAPLKDPNTPLYGNREPARQAAQELRDRPKVELGEATSQADGSPPDGAADPLAAVVSAKEEATSVKKDEASATPESGTAAVKTGAPALPASVEQVPSSVYFVQAGAFGAQSDAEAMRAKLALLGMEARITERQTADGAVYRVRVGPFAEIDQARSARARLEASEITSSLIKATR